MADHSRLDNNSRFDGCIETHGCEVLAAPTGAGLGKDTAHQPDLGVKMAAQSDFAIVAQAAGAILDNLARDLWHAGCGRAGAW